MTTYNKDASFSFAFLPDINIPRNVFDRSHGYQTTLDAGYLVPILCDEILPGDTVTMNSAHIYSRIMTLITPVMDNLYLETFAFFVPNRIIWKNFKAFMGEQRNPDDPTDFLIPSVTTPDSGYSVQSLQDYFGVPVNVKFENINALPFRAYNSVWNYWFRDENLQNSAPDNYEDGPDDPSDYVLRRRGKRHDYFTSALPAPQKGDPVLLPLGKTAPLSVGEGGEGTILLNNNCFGWTSGQATSLYRQNYGNENVVRSAANNGAQIDSIKVSGFYNLVSDLSNATSASINDLRTAFQVQAFQERDMRGGTRYYETVLNHFGVKNTHDTDDPELLAVSSTMLNVSTVPQTSSTNDVSPQGNLSAYGVFYDDKLSFSKSFTEHGYLLILCNIRADLRYQQGLHRMWTRKTKLDLFWPEFAHLGEQPVNNKEIFVSGNTEVDDGVFGYQERYAEYRYFPSMTTGKLRSGTAANLDVWHLAQHFTSTPKLNSEFIEDNPPIDRVIAVQDEPAFLLDVEFDYSCARPIPLYGTPSSLGVHL